MMTSTTTITITADRFDRTAAKDATSDRECLLQIDGGLYNLTAWAKAHPGGVSVLRKFHNKDATAAFRAVGHSVRAHEMLKKFAVEDVNNVPPPKTTSSSAVRQDQISSSSRLRRPRWHQKLFTKEDRVGIHKYLGLFSLLHYAFRFSQMYFGDISAGYGTRLGKGPSPWPVLCLLPHALLSLSSLIFHTVPKERVVGKPMIWQEYRIHNIVFGLRSVICSFLAWLSVYGGHTAPCRRLAVVGSCVTALVAMLVADEGTRRLRVNNAESTTATMPYWEGCSLETQRRFKLFYAYCQFMATLACITVGNPAWGLAVLLAIQIASLCMTLVRKGLLTPKGYHIVYTVALALPYYVGFRSHVVMAPWKFPAMMAVGGVLFQLRRLGVDKFALWLPIFAVRILWGDQFIPYDVW